MVTAMPSAFPIQELPLGQLSPHPDHEPHSFDSPEDEWLLESIEHSGLLMPLIVEEGSLRIVDGHRRYLAAKRLELPSVECSMRPPLSDADYEHLRWSLHETHKPWTQADDARWRRHAR